MTTVLVTGVSRYIGARVAQELSESPGVDRVIGIDLPDPRFPLGGADFVRTDIGNPLVGRIMTAQNVDVVVHLAMSADARSGAARVSQKERNVIGTMQLLATCQAHRPLRRFVLKSTASVYGSSPSDPAVFTEAMTGVGRIRGGHLRDAIEVEGYVRAMARRRPDMATVVLRMAHIVGPHVHSALTDYLRAPVWPSPLGFGARLQLLHPQDAITALVASAVGTADGVINVAGDGVVTLAQAARLLGRPTVPVPALAGRKAGSVLRRFGVAAMGDDQIDYLMWGRCLDTTRMRSLLHMEPQWSTRDIIEEFGRPQPGLRDVPDFPDASTSWAVAR